MPDSALPQHRLDTVTAAAGLRDLAQRDKFVSTSLPRLDAALQSQHGAVPQGPRSTGGVSRGQITEIYGPPGVGKTAICMRLATNALQKREKVVWIDTGFALVGPRFKDVLQKQPAQNDEGEESSHPPTEDEMMENLTYMHISTLPHLLALLLHPPPGFPPPETSLLIVDSPAPLFASAFPRQLDSKDTKQSSRNRGWDKNTWASQRRWPVMGDFVTRLGKLAARNKLAVVLTMQSRTAYELSSRLVLRPALTGREWDSGIHNRIILFRDWPGQHSATDTVPDDWLVRNTRFAQVLKVSGRTQTFSEENVIPFVLESSGPREIGLSQARQRRMVDKSTRDFIELPTSLREEIADSEDEDIDIEDFGSDADFTFADQEAEDADVVDRLSGIAEVGITPRSGLEQDQT